MDKATKKPTAAELAAQDELNNLAVNIGQAYADCILMDGGCPVEARRNAGAEARDRGTSASLARDSFDDAIQGL